MEVRNILFVLVFGLLPPRTPTNQSKEKKRGAASGGGTGVSIVLNY